MDHVVASTSSPHDVKGDVEQRSAAPTADEIESATDVGIVAINDPATKTKPRNLRLSARLSTQAFSPFFSQVGEFVPDPSELPFHSNLVRPLDHAAAGPAAALGLSTDSPYLDFSSSSQAESPEHQLVPTPFSKSADPMGPTQIASPTQGDASIDRQLEMLTEMFPREMKTYSGTFRSSLASPPAALKKSPMAAETHVPQDDTEANASDPSQARDADDDPDDSSDYQELDPTLPRSRVSQILSALPALDESLDGSTLADERTSLHIRRLSKHSEMSVSYAGGNYAVGRASTVFVQTQEAYTEEIVEIEPELENTTAGTRVDQIDASTTVPIGKHLSSSYSSRPVSLAESTTSSRKSNRPSLSVDTEGTKAFAVKELEMIRRLKDKGRAKAEIQPIRAEDIPRLGHKADARQGETAQSAGASGSGDTKAGNASPRRPEKNPAKEVGETEGDVLRRPPGHVRQVSAGSRVSGIVWSAVVERFSEMAQEIAGNGATSQFIRERGPDVVTAAERNSHEPGEVGDQEETTSRSKKSSLVLESPAPEVNGHKAGHNAVSARSSSSSSRRQPCQPAGEQAHPVEDGEQAEYRSSVSDSPPQLDSPVKRKSRSSVDLRSALRQVGKTYDSATLCETDSSGSSIKPKRRAWARKSKEFAARVRVVRIQSHHGEVEGDYADFLKRASASMGRKTGDSDNQDANDADTGADTGSRYSKRSYGDSRGVENGLYRRGSMTSIVSRLTIATVGGASIKDMSRGSRFRRPSPFFACGHGYRKIHGPHQKGNPRPVRREQGKRDSVEGDESLLATLRRVKEEKRNNEPKPSIGELSFEMMGPSKPRRQNSSAASPASAGGPTPPPKSGRPGPVSALPPHPAFAQSQPVSAVLPSHRVAGTGIFSPEHRGYAATSFIPSASRTPISAAAASTVAVTPRSAAPSSAVSKSASTILGGLSAARLQMLNAATSNGSPLTTPSGSTISQSHKRSKSSGESISSLQMQHVRQPDSHTLRHKASGSNVSIPSRSPHSAIGIPSQKVSSGSSAFLQSAGASVSSGSRPPQQHFHVRTTGVPTVLQPHAGRQMMAPQQQYQPAAVKAMSNNFLAMTPSRSDISVGSGRDENGDNGSAPRRPVVTNVPAHWPQNRASVVSAHDRGPSMRSSTLPLPAGAGPHASGPLPLRALSIDQNVRNDPAAASPSRMSAHRPPTMLSIDTELARQKPRSGSKVQQPAASQQPHQYSQPPPVMNPYENNRPKIVRADSMTGVGTLFGIVSPAGQQVSSGARPPKSAATIASATPGMLKTPKRPQHPRETPSPTLLRFPRPPSALPIAVDELHSDGVQRGSAERSNSTRSTSTVKSLFGRFGKRR